jgi:hypothetical protein
MAVCALCGQTVKCLRKVIEGKEYDICFACWTPLAKKLKGKGRTGKELPIVLIPALPAQPEQPPAKPVPGEPPKIFGSGPMPDGNSAQAFQTSLLEDVIFDRAGI